MNSSNKRIATVYCEGAYNTTNGKTAHGLVRFTERYSIQSIIDSRYKGQDAGMVLDGKNNGIPIVGSIMEALSLNQKHPPTQLVVGLAPDGGRLDKNARNDIMKAIKMGLSVDSGLHDYLSDDPEILKAAALSKAQIHDIRKPPSIKDLHFFTGNIEKVKALKIAVLGTDSAVGKRTTGWRVVHGFREAGFKAELIGTGQTAWLQGAKYSLVLDSLVNDFVSGEIEFATYSCWQNEKPDVIVLEGQGSLMNPAYPGGFELLSAGRPDIVILQHAPARYEYDGFPGYPIHPINQQIQAIELLSGKKVVAITVNHENLAADQINEACEKLEKETGLPTSDVLVHGNERLIMALKPYLKQT
ncbi:MAG: DUF1611 domain-containing protein [Ignavibacteriales bacterium]|nr:DUF1611 domain-containing protein [Ignavibacteriales bacterium]MCF8367532.1 DUF1611 domain-containing protein [Bacteroidales bacterium]MCF8402637.1 DUF1611 domain-containing protein [Bacteroidales bacterium]